MSGLVNFVENELTVNVKVYFGTCNSISLIYVCCFMPVPHNLDYDSCFVSFDIRKYESSTFVFVFCFFAPLLSVLGQIQTHGVTVCC